MPFTPVSASDPVAPLENILNTRFAELDNSITAAGNVRQVLSFKWANTAARVAQTGMSEGDIGDQADTDQTYRFNGTTWVNSTSAFSRIIPTVTGPGMSVSSTGVITALNATSGAIISFPSPASYSVIKLEITSSTKSTTNDLTGRIASGATPITTNSYGQVRAFDNGTARSVSTVLGTGPSWNLDTAPTGISDFTLTFTGLALPEQTRIEDNGRATSGYSWQAALWQTGTTAFDGLQFNVSAGTFSFKAHAYGLLV